METLEEIEYIWDIIPSRGGQIPRIRSNSAAFRHKDDIWYIAGKGVGILAEVWRFSLTTNEWCDVACSGIQTPCPRDSHAVALISGDRAVLFGGQEIPSGRPFEPPG